MLHYAIAMVASVLFAPGEPSAPSVAPAVDDVRVELRMDSGDYAVFDPVILHVEITNISDKVIAFDSEGDGLPLLVGVQYTAPQEPVALAADVLRVESSTATRTVLKPGDAVIGEVVLVERGVPLEGDGRGFRSGEPALDVVGEYSLRACLRFEYSTKDMVCSNQINLSVAPAPNDTPALLTKLDEIMIDALGQNAKGTTNREDVRRETWRFLSRIIRRHNEAPQDANMERLVDQLAAGLREFPASKLSPYVARYLALAQKANLAHKVHGGAGSSETARTDPLYTSVEQLLATASPCWPSHSAQYHLAALYLLGHEFGRAEALCEAIEHEARTATAIAEAEKLRAALTEYKTKCIAAKGAD